MSDRYFVTIHASDEREFRRLLDYDLDLFASRKGEGDQAFAVDGLVRLDDIGRLVDAGYRVNVSAPDNVEERPQVSRADEWLKATIDEFDTDLKRGD